MKVAVTGSLKAGENAPIIYRGNYETIFPMMREDGVQAVELHIRDSREIDRKKLETELKKNQLTLTSIGTGAAYGAWHLNIGDHDKGIRKKGDRMSERAHDHSSSLCRSCDLRLYAGKI